MIQSWRHLFATFLIVCLQTLAGNARAAEPSAPKPATLAAPTAAPSFAFYYGADIPWESLGAFDIAVVEPGNVSDAGWQHRLNPQTTVAAYVAVGEVHPTRPYFAAMQPAWRLGTNPDWGSVVVDQSSPQWRAFYLARVIAPLWQRGYRAFFLDTLDSFYLVAKTPEAQKRQIEGMAALVTDIKRAYPSAKLIFNRGFEILPQVHGLAFAVAAESLFQGYDAGKKTYREVPAADREWLWGQLLRCKEAWGLHVIGIDYVPPENRASARATAEKIRLLGAIPWVSNPELNMLGMGAVEVIPRQVLAVHDEPSHLGLVALHELHRHGTQPLNQLGLDSRMVYFGGPEMAQVATLPLAGRYAGVIIWFSRGRFPSDAPLMTVIRQARAEGVPLVLLGDTPNDAVMALLDLEVGPTERVTAPLTLDKRSVHVGFETEPTPIVSELAPLRLGRAIAAGSDVWLRVRAPSGQYAAAVAITPWGGYATQRFWKVELQLNMGSRWAVNPLAFYQAALRIDPGVPMPDVTSENGRRLLTVHIDGDGFPSRAEIPGTPFASEVMLTEFLQRYRLPTTVSVIQAEIASNGLYRALTPKLEDIARQIYRLPHVELASHTFSHPFFWADLELGGQRTDRLMALRVPGYTYNVDTEISGSARYIDTQLAPAGKKTVMLLWSGDTQPLATPVRKAYEAGLLNMNSGNTWMRKSDPSVTSLGPLGIMKGEYYQVYAPNQNENVYTNEWTGPFYGYERVIETFEMTEHPQRVKPVNIYYHTYIASKRASIASLHKVYQWALAQELHPIYSSQYAQRVLDWRRATVATTGSAGELQLRAGGEHLRQWRVRTPAGASKPTLPGSSGFVGSTVHGSDTFLHASTSITNYGRAYWTDGQFSLETAQKLAPALPAALAVELVSANARLVAAQGLGSATVRYRFDAPVGLRSQWRSACTWEAAASSRDLKVSQQGDLLSLQADEPGQKEVVFRCAQ